MDNIWIFVVIIGAAISLIQKVQQNKQNEGSESDNNEKQYTDAKKEFERQIRRILQGEDESIKPASRSVTPSPATATKTTPQVSLHRTKSQSSSIENKSAASTSSNPTSEKIEDILDDFSMEKAVIYSEILNPKYKEY